MDLKLPARRTGRVPVRAHEFVHTNPRVACPGSGSRADDAANAAGSPRRMRPMRGARWSCRSRDAVTLSGDAQVMRTSSVPTRPTGDSTRGAAGRGAMFWFTRKKFVGSNFALIAASRS
jgi:hypothetical protein